MARILLAWELGEGFGHLAKCLQIAQGLSRRGHTAVLALKDLRLPAGVGDVPPGTTVLQAPLTAQPRFGYRRMPVNYADVLLRCGFADAHDLAARLLAWQGIFALARPEALVADHAPTAMLAARLSGIACLAVGNGFAIPPTQYPWPSIRPWEAIPVQDLIAAEQRLDQSTEEAQRALRHAVPVRMRELFGATNEVLDTFAELDHYGARPDVRYLGPVVSVPHSLPVNWQHRTCAKVLAYLRPEVPGFALILGALATLEAEVLCIAHGLSPELARRHATRRLRLALVPVDLPLLLQNADLAISYGNSGFSTQALLAGVPLLMRPRHVEQALFARRVEALGAGQLLQTGVQAQAIGQRLQSLLHSPQHQRAAQVFSDRYRHFSSDQTVERIVDLIEQQLTPRRQSAPAQDAPDAAASTAITQGCHR